MKLLEISIKRTGLSLNAAPSYEELEAILMDAVQRIKDESAFMIYWEYTRKVFYPEGEEMTVLAFPIFIEPERQGK